jgi:hypothetical protein
MAVKLNFKFGIIYQQNLLDFFVEFNPISPRIRIYMQNRFSQDPEIQFNEKTGGRKSRETAPLSAIVVEGLNY